VSPPGPEPGAPAAPQALPPPGVPLPPADPGRPRVEAGRKASLSLVANLGGAALGYAGLLLIGRYVQPSAYGSYLFAVGVVGFLAIVVNLGFSSAHQRHVAMGVPVGQALGVMVRLRLAATGVFLVLVAAAYGLWDLAHGPNFTDATTPRVLAAAVLLQILAGSRQLLLDTWTGQQRVNRVEGLRMIDTALALVVLANGCLLIAALDGHWSPLPSLGAWWARLLGLHAPLGDEQAALLLAGSYLVGRAATLALGLAWAAADRLPVGRWDRALARSYLTFALPVALTWALGLVLQYTDTILLGFFWTAGEVGLYGAAQRLATIATLLGSAVGTYLFPRLAQLHAEGRREKEAATFGQAERYLALLTFPVAAGLVALPAQGLHVAVGDAYLAAAWPLRWLALAAVLMTLEQPLSSRFLAHGRPRLLVQSSAFNAMANVALNLWFIPPAGLGMGPAGAALATLVSTALSYAYLRWRSRREFGAPWLPMSHVRAGVAAAIVGAGWAWLARAAPGLFARAWQLLGWGLLGGALYLALLGALGELTRKDAAFLRRAAHPAALLAELRGR